MYIAVQNRAKGKISPMANTFMLLKIDLIDSWAEIEIFIVAHNLPIEKWNFDQNKC